MKRIVVVDDDPFVRSSAALYFEGVGWSVRQASTVEEARACFVEPFDALVCDLHLSGGRVGEGIGVLVEARRAAPAAVLVLLTGGVAGELGEARPDAVIQKPVRLRVLVQMIDELGAHKVTPP
ncbi:MAG TPA: response regulator [Polyangia bacterium]|nr:response regulator [Polyangia bacterium]